MYNLQHIPRTHCNFYVLQLTESTSRLDNPSDIHELPGSKLLLCDRRNYINHL